MKISQISCSTYQNNIDIKRINNLKNNQQAPKISMVSFKGLEKFVTQKTNKNIFKKLFAAVGLLGTSTAINAAQKNTNKVSYKDYVNIHKYNFPEGSTVTLSSGECIDLTEYANNNAFEIGRGNIVEFIVFDPKSSLKELKKYIPTIRKSTYRKGFEIPSSNLSFPSTSVNLNEKNILVIDKSKKDENYTLYRKDRIEQCVPVEAVINGESGEIDVSKVPYNQKIACYEVMPNKRFFVPAGSTIRINDKVIEVKKDSLAGNIYENSDIDFEENLRSFFYGTEPTKNKFSQAMYKKIKDRIDEKDMYVKSAMGIKFEYDKDTFRYRIGNVDFQVIGNIHGSGGGMDGYYWDIQEATPFELDRLYAAYLTHPKLVKNGGRIILNKDDNRIQVTTK